MSCRRPGALSGDLRPGERALAEPDLEGPLVPVAPGLDGDRAAGVDQRDRPREVVGVAHGTAVDARDDVAPAPVRADLEERRGALTAAEAALRGRPVVRHALHPCALADREVVALAQLRVDVDGLHAQVGVLDLPVRAE